MLTPPPPRRAYLSSSNWTKSGGVSIYARSVLVLPFCVCDKSVEYQQRTVYKLLGKFINYVKGLTCFPATRQHLGTWGEVEKGGGGGRG